MGDHPFFKLRSFEDFHKQDSIILLKPIYTKKILFNAAKPTNIDYIDEAEHCFVYCEPKHKKADEKFQKCLRTCLAKWKSIHEYTSTPEFNGNFLPKKLK